MTCRLFGAKPLTEPMLINYQFYRMGHISIKLYLKFKKFHSRKCIWKCRLQKCRPFVSASMWFNGMVQCSGTKHSTSSTAERVGAPVPSWVLVGHQSKCRARSEDLATRLVCTHLGMLPASTLVWQTAGWIDIDKDNSYWGQYFPSSGDISKESKYLFFIIVTFIPVYTMTVD